MYIAREAYYPNISAGPFLARRKCKDIFTEGDMQVTYARKHGNVDTSGIGRNNLDPWIETTRLQSVALGIGQFGKPLARDKQSGLAHPVRWYSSCIC